MSSNWQGSVHVSAPVEEVYAYLADFTNQADWDETVTKVEQAEPGDVNGVGAKWKSYERLDSLQSDKGRKSHSNLARNAGLAMREVRELTPHQRVAWHSYTMPRMGVTADCAFELTPDAGGTTVSFTVQFNMLAVIESVTKFVFKGLDAKQQAQWQASLENVKTQVERSSVSRSVEVAV